MPLDPKQIGKTIAHLRKKAGFTQKGLADRLFISDKAVSKWERGLSVPDISYLGKLSVLLDVDIDTLLEGKNDSHGSDWKGFLFCEAAGDGISLTDRIFDKPLVYYLLSHFLLVGIRCVCIACPAAQESALRDMLRDGSGFGMQLTYAPFEGESTFFEAVRISREFLGSGRIMSVFEPAVLYGANLTYLCRRAMLNRGRHTLLAAPAVELPAEKAVAFDENKRVVLKDAVSPQYAYGYLPVMFSPGEMLVHDAEEQADAASPVEALTLRETLHLETANRGLFSMSVASAADAMEAAALISLLQKKSGLLIGCPEEIAWRRGLIDDQQLLRAAQNSLSPAYGNYLLKLKK